MSLASVPLPVVPVSAPVGRLVLLWAGAGALAAVGALPYALALNPALAARIPMPLSLFLLVQFMQSFLLLALACRAGLRLGQSLGLGTPLARALVYGAPGCAAPARTLALAAVAGSVVGALLILLDRLFAPLMPATLQAAPLTVDLWKRFLASFYGAVTEELICRLFLMTLLVWICRKAASRKAAAPAAWMAWSGIVGAALLFGLGHLPATAALWPLTAVVVLRALLLNAIAGIVFGWLYWRRGLEHAVLAHFFADIVVHVVGGH